MQLANFILLHAYSCPAARKTSYIAYFMNWPNISFDYKLKTI